MKTKAFLSLTFAVVVTIPLIIFAGCEEPATHPTRSKTPSSSSDRFQETSLEKAKEAMDKVRERREVEYKKMEEVGDFSNASKMSEKIFLEELGLAEMFWTNLVDLFVDNVPKTDENIEKVKKFEKFLAKKVEGDLGKFWFEYMGYFDDLIVEYLRLSFEFPQKTEKDLLLQFGESVREGKTGILFPEFPENL